MEQQHTRHPGSTRLPIWRDANRLLVEIETAVRAFPRYHKYTVGSDLRVLAMRVCRLLARALAATGEERLASMRQLLDTVGDLKITIQLAREVQAFAGFAAFERSATLAVAIGKQGGRLAAPSFRNRRPAGIPGRRMTRECAEITVRRRGPGRATPVRPGHEGKQAATARMPPVS